MLGRRKDFTNKRTRHKTCARGHLGQTDLLEQGVVDQGLGEEKVDMGTRLSHHEVETEGASADGGELHVWLSLLRFSSGGHWLAWLCT